MAFIKPIKISYSKLAKVKLEQRRRSPTSLHFIHQSPHQFQTRAARIFIERDLLRIFVCKAQLVIVNGDYCFVVFNREFMISF